MDRRVRGWQVIAAVAVVGTVGALLPALWKKDRTPPGGLTRPVPLTVFPGNETDPSFSPDGRSLAFIWDGDLYRISVEGSSPRRLTKTEQTEADPAWSRDDRSIAFLRRASDGTSSLILMDREGGKERRIVSFRAHDGLTWTPDGRWLLASRRETETSPYAIVLVDPTTGEIHPLSRPAPDSFGDRSPSISPTGRTVAAVRGSTAESGGIVLLRLEGNPPTAIQEHMAMRVSDWEIGSPAWTQDGRDLVFAAANGDGPGVWRLALGTSRTPLRLRELGPARGNAALSRPGELLIFPREWKVGERMETDLMLVTAFR
jgi:Tol biopolymer transport system component